MANSPTYAQQLLIDCLNELFSFEPWGTDKNARALAIENDIQRALAALYGTASSEYETNVGLLTGPTDNVDFQEWRLDRAKKKIQHIVNSFGDRPDAEPEPEVVITIIVKVFIDLEKLRRQQNNEPPMTEEEETSKREHIWKFFESSWNTLRSSGDVVKLINQYSDFIRLFLPPPS